jgi:hypothetical protein
LDKVGCFLGSKLQQPAAAGEQKHLLLVEEERRSFLRLAFDGQAKQGLLRRQCRRASEQSNI